MFYTAQICCATCHYFGTGSHTRCYLSLVESFWNQERGLGLQENEPPRLEFFNRWESQFIFGIFFEREKIHLPSDSAPTCHPAGLAWLLPIAH